MTTTGTTTGSNQVSKGVHSKIRSSQVSQLEPKKSKSQVEPKKLLEIVAGLENCKFWNLFINKINFHQNAKYHNTIKCHVQCLMPVEYPTVPHPAADHELYTIDYSIRQIKCL